VNRSRMLTALGLGILYSVGLAGVPSVAAQESVLAYLPDESLLDGWETMGDPQTAEGEDLFLLINGGAEIYNEYGFSRAVIHSYTKGDKSVNLEVYEMEDAPSAYGAYSFKTGRGGEPIEIGSEATFEDYYLNFWKGNVVVTLIGFDTDSGTRDAILTLARIVEAKISAEGARPVIVDLLPETSNSGERVHPTYLEGNLGLLNRYGFGAEDVFGLSSAVVGDYGDYLLFLFPYASDGEADEWFHRAVQSLSSNDRFSNVTAFESVFSADDRDGRYVFLRPAREFLIVYVGDDREEASSVFASILERIAEHTEELEQ